MKRFLVCAAFAALLFPVSTEAQELSPRFGAGTHILVSTIDGVGLGAMARVSIPVNADFSLAIGPGFTGFVLGGTEDATWLFTPQISGIVTLPGRYRAPYFTVGAGGYFPLGEPGRERSGPTIHFGVGRVTLLAESTLFYEVDPMLVLSGDRIDLAVPIRVGLIF
jgi:hypothetical protein